ncbi:MAG: type secretion-associated protein ImpA family [Gammaproteobacteria bacterium]|nr:type secretion-associated protein ImpA family [Gammaproteobacteria bacterium]
MVTNNSPLCEPVSVDAPCGIDLEDTQLLASFDAFRVFGGDTSVRPDIDWPGVRTQALKALAQSRDLRLLTHLAAATLRVEGIKAFCVVLTVADCWLTQCWDLVFPRVQDDALLRQNALNCLADPMAIVAPLRRSPIISQRQFGTFTLRDVELATGQLEATDTDRNAPGSAQIEAALAAAPIEELSILVGELAAAGVALDSIVANMQHHAGPQSAPDFAALAKPLARIRKVLTEHLAARATDPQALLSAGLAPDIFARADGTAGAEVSGSADGVEIIKSRQEAIRAIDAAVLFFRRYEPSSPVPLLLERARRLVSKSFMEVLEDIAPEGVPQAKLVGGIRAAAE